MVIPSEFPGEPYHAPLKSRPNGAIQIYYYYYYYYAKNYIDEAIRF